MKDRAPDTVPRGLSGLGVSSAVCGLCGYFFPLSALFGIVLGAMGLSRSRKDVLCWAGIVLSVIFLVSGIVTMTRLCGSPGMESMLAGSS